MICRKQSPPGLDRNKTALTHRVTAVATAYLDGLGCKPVETEVPVAPGWVADVASYWYPTKTECKKLQLDRRVQGLLLDEGCSGEGLAVRLFGHGPWTVLVEVKTSRADFAGDAKFARAKPANLCFLAYPHGVLTKEDLPEGWEGLECSSDGSKLLRVIRSWQPPAAVHIGQTLDFVAQVGIRRDHRTRHRAAADWLRSYRAEDREKQVAYRADRLLRGLAEWIQGTGYQADRPLSEVLPSLGIKTVPHYLAATVEFFERLKERENGGVAGDHAACSPRVAADGAACSTGGAGVGAVTHQEPTR